MWICRMPCLLILIILTCCYGAAIYTVKKELKNALSDVKKRYVQPVAGADGPDGSRSVFLFVSVIQECS